MRIRMICIALAGALVLPGWAKAQDEDRQGDPSSMLQEMRDYYGDEAFITIATGSRKPVYRAPAVATVITAEEIKAMGARHLDEVLQTVAGLHVAPSGLNRLDSIYSIRGVHTGFNPHVLVLRNGIPFPFLFTGGRPTLFRLPVSSISRVEVIRGPGSAIYGADAFAGIINIITKDAFDIPGTEIGGRIGSFDTHDLWIQHGRLWDNWEVVFSLEWQESSGDRGRRIGADFQTTLDELYGTNASLAPGPLSTRYNILDTYFEIKYDKWRLRNWFWHQDDSGQGAGGAQALDHKGGQDADLFLSDLSFADKIANWDYIINANYFYNRAQSRLYLLPPGTEAPLGSDGNINFSNPVERIFFPEGVIGNPGTTDQQVGLDLTTFTEIRDHRLRVGVGYRYQKERTREIKNFGPGVEAGLMTDVTNTIFEFMPDSSRHIYYLSFQDEWQFAKNWELTAGVRYDNYSDFGDTVNPRIALVWSTLHNLTTKVLYGRAFRSPSFSEQYAINNPVVLGNPELKPENIDTLELAIDYRPTFDLRTNVNFFVYKAQDLIEFVPETNGATRIARNARDQEGYGFEFEFDWRCTESLRLLSNYSWQRSQDAESRSRVPDAPGQKVYVRADWGFINLWSIHPQLTWVGGRKRISGDPRPAIDDYVLIDLMLLRSKILGNIDFAFAVRNVFDEEAREASNGLVPDDYPLEGRNVWAELRYRF